jgi:microcystin-dependent protein
MGQMLGTENVTLSVNELPPHRHAFSAAGAASTDQPQGQVPAAVTSFNLYAPSPATAPNTLAPTTVTYVGGGLPHNNVMPSLALNYIICLYGAYPSFP